MRSNFISLKVQEIITLYSYCHEIVVALWATLRLSETGTLLIVTIFLWISIWQSSIITLRTVKPAYGVTCLLAATFFWSLEHVQCKLTCINPFLTSGLVHSYHSDNPIYSFRGFWWNISTFIVLCIEIPVSKQCRPWSDAAFCGVWTGSALFA